MSILLDTNILTRSAQPAHAMHQTTVDAVDVLRRRGEVLHLVPQNFYEFWVVATRPVGQNGMGPSPAHARAETGPTRKLINVLYAPTGVFSHSANIVTPYTASRTYAHYTQPLAAM